MDFDNADSKKGCCRLLRLRHAQQITSNTGKLIISDEVSNDSFPEFKISLGKQVTQKRFLVHGLEEWSLDTD